jgi:hypothetical protein
LWAKNAHEHCYSKKFSYLVPDNTFIIKDIAWDYNSRFLAINLQYKSPDSHNETNKIIIIKYDGSWKKELSETRSIKNFAWHQKDNILAYVHECTVYGANVFSGESQKIVTFPEEIKKIAWNHDGKKLAIGISVEDGDSSIYIMKSHMNDPKKSYISCEFKRNSKLLNFVWGPNEIIAASYFDGFVVFYDTKKRKEVATIRTSFWLPYYLSWNKDGRLFAIAGFGGLDLEKVFIIKDFFGPSIHSCKEITEKIQS